jgi:hypothetical protein
MGKLNAEWRMSVSLPTNIILPSSIVAGAAITIFILLMIDMLPSLFN